MKKILRITTTALALILLAARPGYGAEPAEDPFGMSLEENINLPRVPSKRSSAVKESADALRSALSKAGYNTGRLRHGEALMISLPCSELFRSNADTLSAEGVDRLSRLKLLDNYQAKYKLLIAVHTDDTGENGYADAITSQRANAIDDFLTEQLGLASMIIIPYGIGRDEPLETNETMAGRAKNRRVELYLIPQKALFSKK